MLRFIISLMGLTGCSVVISEVLKKGEIIPETTSILFIVVPLITLYVIRVLSLKPLADSSDHRQQNKMKFLKVGKAYYGFLSFVSLIMLCSIPFLWWGVIEETIKRERPCCTQTMQLILQPEKSIHQKTVMYLDGCKP